MEAQEVYLLVKTARISVRVSDDADDVTPYKIATMRGDELELTEQEWEELVPAVVAAQAFEDV